MKYKMNRSASKEMPGSCVMHPAPRRLLRQSPNGRLRRISAAVPRKIFPANGPANGNAGMTIGKWSDLTIRDWNRVSENFSARQELNRDLFSKVTLRVFRLENERVTEVEWSKLDSGIRKAFIEVFNTSLKAGCAGSFPEQMQFYQFYYGDIRTSISAICTVMRRDFTFYYKEMP